MNINSFVVSTYLPPNNRSQQQENGTNNINRLSQRTVSVQDYKVNQQYFREQAYLRSQQPSAYTITKTADGSIVTTPKENSNNEIHTKILDFHFREQSPNFSNIDEISYFIDYYSSEYVQFKTRIEQLHSGKESTERLAHLDNLINKQIETYAEGFSSTMTSYFTKHGVEVSESNIKNSVIDLFHQRIEAYEKFVNDNTDFTNLTGTEEEWLLQDNYYMGDVLRFSFANNHSELKLESEYGYSLDELTATGLLINNTHELAKDPFRSKIGRSEEELGIELGITTMKFELIKEHFTMSNPFKDTLEKVFVNYIKQRNQAESEYIIRKRQDPFVRNKNRYATDWNEKYVHSLIEQITSSLKSDNVRAAINKNISSIYELYKQKVQENGADGLSRYYDLMQTWNPDVYLQKWSVEQYLNDWNQFIAKLPVGHEIDRYQIHGTNVSIDLKV